LAMRAPMPQVQAAMFLLAPMEVLLMELLKLCRHHFTQWISVYLCIQG
jgi:hypothetical protein